MIHHHSTVKAICICFLFVLLFVPVICRGDADTIYRENSPAVVVIIAIDRTGKAVSQGSGFIVREDGAVVTNYHVIDTATDLKIKIGGKLRDAEGVFSVDPENDLAIIKLEGKDYPKVKIGDASKLQVGERVYVIGSPQGLENTLSEGIISGIREVDQHRNILQMTAAISPGSSGGPVFNNRGEVIGVATFLIAETQSLNFAMPINLIMPGLANRKLVSTQEACQVDFNETAACWYYQGLAYGTIGDYDRAANAFMRSLTIDSKKVEAYINLGVSYANLGKYREAIDIFNKALQIDPNKTEALNKLGAAYSNAGRSQEALATLKKSMAIKPNDPQIYYTLAVTYGKMDQLKEAAEAAKEAVRLAPQYADAHGYLGITYGRMSMYSEAAASFKTAIRLAPDDPLMHFGLGETYVAMGDKASALEEYKILKKLNPKMADRLFDSIYK